MRRRLRFWIGGLALAAGVVFAMLAVAALILQTAWFKNKVRERIEEVAAVATGGRVEIGSFNYEWRSLTADLGPFVIHGKEPAGSTPFFRAQQVRVRMKVVSMLERRFDVAAVIVDEPRLSIVVNPDGTTNVPVPAGRGPSNKNFAEQLLDLRVRHFEARNGFAEYNSQQIPIDLKADELSATMSFEPRWPRYQGSVSSKRLEIGSPKLRSAVAANLDLKGSLERNQIEITQVNFESGGVKAALKGSVRNLSAPRADFEFNATAPVKELAAKFRIPIESVGRISIEGKGSANSNPSEYKLEGKLSGDDLALERNGESIRGIALSSHFEVGAKGIRLPDLEIRALRGRFTGSAEVAEFKRFTVSGTAKDFSLKVLAEAGKHDIGALSGAVSGKIHAQGDLTPVGAAAVKADADLEIAPGTEGVQVAGALAVKYDQRDGTLEFGESHLSLGSTSFQFSGALASNLNVHITSHNFNDILALFPLFGKAKPDQLPVSLEGGVAHFNGQLGGSAANPRISGKFDATALNFEKNKLDNVAVTFDLDASSVNFHNVTFARDSTHVDGRGRVGLSSWKVTDASPISASVSLQGADLQRVIRENGYDIPASGTISATAQVTGTWESPLISASVHGENITAYDEHLDRARADVTMSATAVEIANAEAYSGKAKINGSGAYNHLANDWKDGSLRADVQTQGLTLAGIKHVQQWREGLDGDLVAKGSVTAKVVEGEVALSSLTGELAVKNVVVDGRTYGNVELTANTHLPVLGVAAKVNLRGVQLEGSGEWRMDGDYSGQARIAIPRIAFSTLHDLWPGEHLRKDLPFGGNIEGEAVLSGPLNDPSKMRASVTLNTVQLTAGPNVHPVTGIAVKDLALRNAGPVIFDATTKSIDIRSASFVAKDTTLSATGKFTFDAKAPWDAAVKGNIDLSILQLFNPDLLASGKSMVTLTVRGPATEPQVDGRVELHDASVFIRDLPNGVDQANGLILFDRNRATIQHLAGVTGGGEVTFESGSFIGFRGPALVYRLQARAQQVRYRSPEGFSITANATVSLIGTSQSSVLSGSVSVVRANFTPRTDVGSLLASTAKPVSLPSAPSEYLQGLQFDVSITSSRSLEVETSMVHNIQADVNLRLRGTPDRPIILGNVSVTSGEIEFFGNKYTITRGDVNFYNPAKIEPIISMDLETKVRGIVVDITFTGPLEKLNFSYRSDPPLEPNEIISLLAVGRQPSELGGLASAQSTNSTSYLSTGSNALLGQALAPASGRLQRLFGVSHIKIDPQLNDITSVPQARLTLEQQVSPAVTMTYITNLSRTDQQIVRVEWDFSKKWSAVALRDENGAFGIDFQYRKRFK